MSVDTSEEADVARNLTTPEEILEDVRKNEGKVHPDIAQRFINIVEAKTSTDGIAAENTELQLNLFDSISARQEPGDLRYLNHMNERLEFDKSFREETNQAIDDLSKGDGFGKLGFRWAGANPDAKPLAEILADMDSGAEVDTEMRFKVLNFISAEFSSAVGLKNPVQVLPFESENRGHQGFATVEGGRPVSYVNTNSTGFKEPGLGLVNTAVHEAIHAAQRVNLMQGLRNGEIGKDHEHYTAARKYEIEFRNYVKSNIQDAAVAKELLEGKQIDGRTYNAMVEFAQLTHAAYEAQSIEFAAREGGDRFEANIREALEKGVSSPSMQIAGSDTTQARDHGRSLREAESQHGVSA